RARAPRAGARRSPRLRHGARRLRTRQGALRGVLRGRPPARLDLHPARRGAPAAGGGVTTRVDAMASDLARVVAGEHRDPHRVLGPHVEGGRAVIRAYRPDATAVTLQVDGGEGVPTSALDHQLAGVFVAELASADIP